MADAVTLTLLREADAEPLLAFERENRAFFARWITDRGDDYFASFAARHQALVDENRAGTSLLYLVRDATDRLVGRVNVTDLHDPGITELGYRLAERAQGRGLATRMVGAALTEAKARGVRRIRARTTSHNSGSQRVLERAGFSRTSGPVEALEVAGATYPVLHYVITLQPDEG